MIGATSAGIGKAKRFVLRYLGGVLAEAFPGRIDDLGRGLRAAGEPEVERRVKGAEGQREQHDDVEELAELALLWGGCSGPSAYFPAPRLASRNLMSSPYMKSRSSR